MTALTRLWQGCPSPYLRMAILCAAFFLLYNIYCFFWRHTIGGAHYDFVDSQIFWVKEWAVTVLLGTLVITALTQRTKPIQLASVASVFIVIYVASSVVRIFIDYDFYGRDWGASIVTLTPKYFLATTLLLLGCWICTISSPRQTQQQAFSDSIQQIFAKPQHQTSDGGSLPEEPSNTTNNVDTLEVELRGISRRLPLEGIHYIQAAGNYVQIHTANECYIKRSTVKQLADTLPQQDFMRVHRSFIVNLATTTQLYTAASGSTYLLLSANHKVPVSKSRRHEVKTHLSRQVIHP